MALINFGSKSKTAPKTGYAVSTPTPNVAYQQPSPTEQVGLYNAQYGTSLPVGSQVPSAPPPSPWAGGNLEQQNWQKQDAKNAGPPPGFQKNKWQDESLGTSHKYVGGLILASGGGINDILAHPMFAGWKQVSGDKIQGPAGSVYDVFKDFGGANQVQWTAVSGPAWDKNGIPGVNSYGIPSSLKNDGIKGNYSAATKAAQYGGMGGPGLEAMKNDGIKGNYAAALKGGLPGSPGSFLSSYTAQFDDPSTKQLEQFLMNQLGALGGQYDAQATANQGFKGQMGEAQAATQRLLDFLGQRATSLQQPAYTGPELEILRTQMLDPIERDRQAAQKRALEYNIGGRGFEPTSGIARQVVNDVDANYDQLRARAQGDLAYRQINERRSREQEAQGLLGMIPQLQRGASATDLQFLQMLDAALNAPAQQGLNLSQMLYRLPAQAQNDALAAMGMGPSADSVFSQAMGLYNVQNQQQQQGLGWYQMLGSMLPYLMSQPGGGA